MDTSRGALRLHKPLIYQEAGGVRREVAGGYILRGKHQVGLRVAAYDLSRPLIIDPVLSYSTYLGGSSVEEAFGIAVDSGGNAYVTGRTFSRNFPTVNALQPAFGGGSQDAFVAKINAAGSALVYSTYLGGSNDDEAFGIAVDSGGNAFVTGWTGSSNFPTVNALQPTFGGLLDAFVAKINAAGSALVYSTYLGGNGIPLYSGYDSGRGIAVDSGGNAYVTGFTSSSNFPTVNAFQPTCPGNASNDAFVAKINATGSALVYSSCLGADQAYGSAIAVDSAGNAYMTGTTSPPCSACSVRFPTVNALQPTYGGGTGDAFVAKINAAGSGLVYSTYLGGSLYDQAEGIAVDSTATRRDARKSPLHYVKRGPTRRGHRGRGRARHRLCRLCSLRRGRQDDDRAAGRHEGDRPHAQCRRGLDGTVDKTVTTTRP